MVDSTLICSQNVLINKLYSKNVMGPKKKLTKKERARLEAEIAEQQRVELEKERLRKIDEEKERKIREKEDAEKRQKQEETENKLRRIQLQESYEHFAGELSDSIR